MKALTLWIPLLCLAGAITNSFVAVPYFYEELGLIENLTVIFLIIALFSLLWHAKGHFAAMAPLDKALVVVMVLGCIYFTGEELSWGQHFFGFETSEAYQQLNRQKETNVHNLEGIYGGLFDKIPRTLLTVGIFFGGILFPFIKDRLPDLIRRYVPGKDVLLTSILAVFITLPPKIYKMVTGTKLKFDSEPGTSKSFEVRFDGGEMKEMYIALFILLFVIFFIGRRKTGEAAGG